MLSNDVSFGSNIISVLLRYWRFQKFYKLKLQSRVVEKTFRNNWNEGCCFENSNRFLTDIFSRWCYAFFTKQSHRLTFFAIAEGFAKQNTKHQSIRRYSSTVTNRFLIFGNSCYKLREFHSNNAKWLRLWLAKADL